jgi:NitT/TauT family transport system substrate-binding protein
MIQVFKFEDSALHLEEMEMTAPGSPHCIRPWSLVRVVALLLLTLPVIACEKQSDRAEGPPEKVTIAYATTPFTTLVQIALLKGYFTAEGLDVTPQTHEFGKLALQSVIEGKADLATSGDTPVMFAVMGGKKTHTLAVVARSTKGEAIVARRDRGISTPDDLKGKTIGVTLGTTGDFFLESFLALHGIGREAVRIVDMRPNEMTEAIVTGRVDAVAFWSIFMNQLVRRLGDNGIAFYEETIYSDITCLTAMQEYVKTHPGAVRRILRALIRAEAFVNKDPEESRRLVAESIKIDQVYLDEIWESFDFKVTLDQSLLVSLEDQTRWANRNRLTEAVSAPNYLDFIYLDGLQSVKPEAVRVIR